MDVFDDRPICLANGDAAMGVAAELDFFSTDCIINKSFDTLETDETSEVLLNNSICCAAII
ncbi:hypothetical protein T10_12399 [Trichinella papuae]|uniref:Uncharacterized protein n=1 Tax=Trichinella papuae TaxID=268474 RepID=A0A0V1N4H4_9BILA|nr:hypothetical protein T10_12399 [Trichinella papuae]